MSIRRVYAGLTKDEKKMALAILSDLAGADKTSWLLLKNAAETLRLAQALKEAK